MGYIPNSAALCLHTISWNICSINGVRKKAWPSRNEEKKKLGLLEIELQAWWT